MKLTIDWDQGTVGEGVASVSRVTRTDRHVINRFAAGLQSAGARARVTAFHGNAGHRLGAIGILRALGPASFIWVTNEVWRAGTEAHAVVLAAVRVDAAWGGAARVPKVWAFI